MSTLLTQEMVARVIMVLVSSPPILASRTGGGNPGVDVLQATLDE